MTTTEQKRDRRAHLRDARKFRDRLRDLDLIEKRIDWALQDGARQYWRDMPTCTRLQFARDIMRARIEEETLLRLIKQWAAEEDAVNRAEVIGS